MRISISMLPLFLFLLAGCLAEEEPLRVEEGDLVTIDYVGSTLGDNLVFDTSREDIARDEKVKKVPWFRPREEYKPLEFRVGMGEVLPALEQELIGTAVGSEKVIVLSPEEAYGHRNQSLLLAIERVAVVPLVVDIPLEVFEAGLGSSPVVNETVQLRYWSARVLNVSEDWVTLRNLAVNGTVVETAYAPAEVTVNSTHIRMELIPPKNVFYNTPLGPAKVIAENQTTIVLDYNHPLAGKTLVFHVEVKNITKGVTKAKERGWPSG